MAVALHQLCAPAMQQPILRLGLFTTISYSTIASKRCTRARAVVPERQRCADLQRRLGSLVEDADAIDIKARGQAQRQLHVGALACSGGVPTLPGHTTRWYPCRRIFSYL